jgi:hypothetical protein
MTKMRRVPMRKILLFLILAITFSGLVVLNSAHAEGVFEAEKFPYKEMQIQVMPEFDYPENWPKDEPSLLIGYYGTIVNKTGKDFSGSIEFPLPIKDRNFSVYLIAEFPDDNKPEVQRPYKINEEKGTVVWQPGKPIKQEESYKFVIEYYANPIQADGPDKKFNFEFIPPAETEQLDLIIYTPLNSQEFNLEPPPVTSTESEYGQELQHYQYKDVKKGTVLTHSASYKKDGNESALSIISKMNPPADDNHNGTATAQTEKKNTVSKERPIIDAVGAAIIGVSIVIAGGLVFFGLKGSRKTSAVRKPQKFFNKKIKSDGTKVTTIAEEKKNLRSMLLNGKIDQRTYEEKMKKLI